MAQNSRLRRCSERETPAAARPAAPSVRHCSAVPLHCVPNGTLSISVDRETGVHGFPQLRVSGFGTSRESSYNYTPLVSSEFLPLSPLAFVVPFQLLLCHFSLFLTPHFI